MNKHSVTRCALIKTHGAAHGARALAMRAHAARRRGASDCPPTLTYGSLPRAHAKGVM